MTEKKTNPVNPFHIQGRIRDLKLFYGRKSELKAIWGFLSKDANVSIVGKRQLGKSSLLWYIKEKAIKVLKDEQKPRPEVFYFDMEIIRSEEEFFDGLAKELKLKEKYPTSRELERKLEGKRVILCLDEFDRTAHNDNFSDEFFGILRGLSQGDNFTLVVATKIPLKDYANVGMTSPLFNIFPPTPITLGPFAKEEAEELLKGIAPVGGKEFPAGDMRKALKIVKEYFPWNVQYMGWCWFESGFDMEKARKLYKSSLKKKRNAVRFRKRKKEWRVIIISVLIILSIASALYAIFYRDNGISAKISALITGIIAALGVLYTLKSNGK